MNLRIESEFADHIDYELKRAERYRYFVSLVVFNVGPIIDLGGNGQLRLEQERTDFVGRVRTVISKIAREVDAVSNQNSTKIGLLLPETSRQGAESAARRISDSLNQFCSDYFRKQSDYMVPIEISSFPDAAGTRSVASYIEDFTD